jgi:ribonuclease HI
MRYAVRLHFPASNNMAEYEALLCGLKIVIETGIKRLDVRGDSQLVIDQVMKNTSCHDDKMEAYYKAVRAIEEKFYGIELNHVPRRYNEEADECCGGKPQLSHTNNEGKQKLKNQNQNTEQRTAKGSFLDS